MKIHGFVKGKLKFIRDLLDKLENHFNETINIKMMILNWVNCLNFFTIAYIVFYPKSLLQFLSIQGFLLVMLGIISINLNVLSCLPLSGPIQFCHRDIHAVTAFITTLCLVHFGIRLHRHIHTHSSVQPAHRTFSKQRSTFER